MAQENSSVPNSTLLSPKNLQVPGFSGAERPRNPLRRLPLALLSLLGVLFWSCSSSSAGALLSRPAVAPGRPAAFSAGGRRQRLADIPGELSSRATVFTVLSA